MSLKGKLDRFLIKICNYVWNVSFSHNISFELQKEALRSTANFVNLNLKDIESVSRREEIWDIAIQKIKNSSGIILEFGVYKGESINYIASKLPEETIYGFDSFEGLPEFWRDGLPLKSFKVENQNKLKIRDNVVLLKGYFENTLPEFLKKNDSMIKLMHIDSDLYSSAKTIFNYTKERIQKGTIIIFDEFFNYPGWENGEFLAFKEFTDKTKIGFKYFTYNLNGEQLAVVIT
jgi:predicted O-methyltransferase YrrM